MLQKKERNWFLKEGAVQSIAASILCVLIGLLIGFIVLLIIRPEYAWKGITNILKNFLAPSRADLRLKSFGNTLAKTSPLIMTALSILFCYKVGLFNIGAAGQYVVGAAASLYAALVLKWHWLPCVLLAVAAGMIYGAIVGVLKAYANVNEVISGIMLNWIGLYLANMLLSATAKDSASNYTIYVTDTNPSALIPALGLNTLFGNDKVTMAIPAAILIAIFIKILLDKTKFGYELKATGFNKNAAKYAGMAEKRNLIVSLMIGGALAALGAALYFLVDYERWSVSASSVPAMGFNGIAAAFLGGLNPIGTIFSSFFIQHISDGGAYINHGLSGNPFDSQFSSLISSIIIYLCGFVFFMKYLMNKVLAKKDEEAMKAAAMKEAKSLTENMKEPLSESSDEKGGTRS